MTEARDHATRSAVGGTDAAARAIRTGLNNEVIARRPFITNRTVETNVAKVLQQLDIDDAGDGHRRRA